MPHEQYPPQTGTTQPRTTQLGLYRPGPRRGPRPPRKTRPTRRLGLLLSVLAAVVAVIVLFGFGAAAETFGHKDTVAATSPGGKSKAAKPAKGSGTAARPPGLGNPVRDGKFEFVVSRVDCSKSTVGLPHLDHTATGKYCVVSLSVKNVADKPQLFLGSAQRAFDAAGTKFTDDEIAGLYVNHDTETFLQKINPGGKVVGKIVFDVPKATTLTTIELHDSFFSGGAKVTLR